ncbi:MAG TPA: iron-sulfur cluster repair di-iron protein [Sphingobacterium sp.]|nr:iron-sulfur cluster repair di-iron protein [Sphingobacterium sp.]
METLLDKRIGDVVAEDFRTAAVFSKFGIDFCCGGQQPIIAAATKKNLNVDNLQQELEKVLAIGTAQGIDYNAWPLDLLASYIVKIHHRYVGEKSPVLVGFLNKLCRVHGDRHPELFEVFRLFQECAVELGQHMEKEENILFPFIEEMEEAKSRNIAFENPYFGTVGNPINMMVHEHETEGRRFEKIAELTSNYTPPADACGTYRVTYAMLQEFEQDLHKHIHLENNILFPKSIVLERSFR